MSDGKIPAAWNSVRRLLALGKGNALTRIIIFGTGDHTPHEVQIRSGFRWALLLAAVLLLAGGGHYAWLLVSADPAPLSVIEERDALRRLNRGYALDTERMAGRVESLEVQMRKLAVLAGAPPIATRIGGIGGPVGTAADYDYVSERLEDLSGRVAALDQQGVALERTMQEKSKLLASTPSIWPVRGYLSSGFGRRNDPFTGELEWHYGLDISANTGTPARVTADGVVIDTSTSPTYGKYVVVSHGFGVVTRYAHLSRIDVRRSQRLRRNEVVGLVGNTGRSRAPHLHYEVWLNERAQNPLDHIVDYVP